MDLGVMAMKRLEHASRPPELKPHHQSAGYGVDGKKT